MNKFANAFNNFREAKKSITESKKGEKKYTFYWLTGERQVLEGGQPNEALMLAGYGGGAIRALDFYAEGDDHSYKWNAKEKTWQSLSTPKQEGER